MALPMVTCPLCCQPGFSTSDSLCAALVGVTTRKLCCPICNDVVYGLDKLTIHLFSHSIKSPGGMANAVENPDQTIEKEGDETFEDKEVACAEPHPTSSLLKRPDPLKSIVNPGEKVLLLKADNGQIFAVSHDAFLSAIKSATTSSSIREPVNPNENARKPALELRSCSMDTQEDSDSVIIVESEDGKKNESMEFQSCRDLLAKGDFSTDDITDTSYKLPPSEETSSDEEQVSMASKSGKETIPCDLCSFTFPNKIILAMHKQLIHRKVESDCEVKRKSFECSVCGKSFKMRGSLMIHRRVAHNIGISKENPEPVKSPSPPLPPPPKPACQICGKFFKKETHLTQHLKAHEDKKWQCLICSKTFSTKYFLKKHRRLHTGEMPYRCSTCNKTFTFQQSYHKHLSYHNDEKPYCCSQCGRLFKEFSTLQNHERIHSGEKPFSCETCGKAFRQRVSYLVHRRIHTGVMPYKCTACNKSFRYKMSERTHKCPAQPPGVVIRTQPKLAERLQAAMRLKASEKSAQAECEIQSSTMNGDDSSSFDAVTTSKLGALENQGQNSTGTTNEERLSETLSEDSAQDFLSKVDGAMSEGMLRVMYNGEESLKCLKSKEVSDLKMSPATQSTCEANVNSDIFSFILSPTLSSPSDKFGKLSLSPNSTPSCSWDLVDEKTLSYHSDLSANHERLLENITNDALKEFFP